MSGFKRKLLREKMKKAIKSKGEKQVAPLSKYRFKTKEEMYAEKLTEQMLQQAKNSMNNQIKNK